MLSTKSFMSKYSLAQLLGFQHLHASVAVVTFALLCSSATALASLIAKNCTLADAGADSFSTINSLSYG